jgi:hypothetical protein
MKKTEALIKPVLVNASENRLFDARSREGRQQQWQQQNMFAD